MLSKHARKKQKTFFLNFQLIISPTVVVICPNSSISTAKPADCGEKHLMHIKGLICHQQDHYKLPGFYLGNEHAVSYFESSWASSIKSWFHGRCVKRWEAWTAIESIVLILRPGSSSVSSFLFQLHRVLCLQSIQHISEGLISSRRVWLNMSAPFFQRSLSTPALYQPSLGGGRETQTSPAGGKR